LIFLDHLKDVFLCCLQVLLLDPTQEESIELVKLAELFYKHNIPLRYVCSTIAFNTFYLSLNIYIFLIWLSELCDSDIMNCIMDHCHRQVFT